VRRREFITLLGGAAAAWPLAAQAQQSAVPVIGFLGADTPSTSSRWVAAFVQRLSELGWTEGRTVAIEYRWAGGRSEPLSELATEFVKHKVDIIVTWTVAPVLAAKQATSIIPIVFAVAADPVGTRLVASLARPDGNATGLSSQTTDLAAKRLEILREMSPALSRLAVIGNPGSASSGMQMHEVQQTARTLGIETILFEIRRSEDIAPAFEAFQAKAEAIYVVADPLVFTNREPIIALARSARLATMYGFREFVESGGMISYGPSFPDLFRRAADYVDKILRGAKPADLPVEQPTKFELVINLTTAKALSLEISPTLLARADEVIE
jgi:putative tryptophan/tyrosine transport system substrate-binding protein